MILQLQPAASAAACSAGGGGAAGPAAAAAPPSAKPVVANVWGIHNDEARGSEIPVGRAGLQPSYAASSLPRQGLGAPGLGGTNGSSGGGGERGGGWEAVALPNTLAPCGLAMGVVAATVRESRRFPSVEFKAIYLTPQVSRL